MRAIAFRRPLRSSRCSGVMPPDPRVRSAAAAPGLPPPHRWASWLWTRHRHGKRSGDCAVSGLRQPPDCCHGPSAAPTPGGTARNAAPGLYRVTPGQGLTRGEWTGCSGAIAPAGPVLIAPSSWASPLAGRGAPAGVPSLRHQASVAHGPACPALCHSRGSDRPG